MIRAAALFLAAFVLVPASAGAGTPRSPLSLTATPAHVALVGAARAEVRVTNPGRSAVVVDVGRAGFSLDLRGRPRVVERGGARAAASWLTVAPGRFVLRPGGTRFLTVISRPRRLEPGDHDALVLLTTRPRRDRGVAVRMRIGVVVVVRAPGRIVRRLAVRDLRVRRAGGRVRVLELRLANAGNVTESLGRGQVRVALRRGTLDVGLRAGSRTIRPRTDGVVQFRCPRFLRGWLTANVRIASAPGRPASRRTFRVRL